MKNRNEMENIPFAVVLNDDDGIDVVIIIVCMCFFL